tara:strand:+ start:49 stop:696 length:648 start_codon:yes stop_codon:yes gene_type:complete
MAVLSTGNTFTTGDQVTATTLNNAVNGASFASGAVDSTTTSLSSGAIIVKDGGITATKLETGTNGQLFIGNGTGFTKATLTAGAGVAITNASAAITVSAASLGATPAQYYLAMVDKTDTTGKTLMVSTAYQNAGAGNGDTVFPTAKAVFSGFFTANTSINSPEYQSGGTKVVGTQQAAIADLALTGSDYATEYATINTKINDLLAKLRTHGLIAT